MRARNYVDHIGNAGHFYELAASVMSGQEPGAYEAAKGLIEMSTLALDLAREARLCDSATLAQERALAAEQARAARAAKAKNKKGSVAMEPPGGY